MTKKLKIYDCQYKTNHTYDINIFNNFVREFLFNDIITVNIKFIDYVKNDSFCDILNEFLNHHYDILIDNIQNNINPYNSIINFTEIFLYKLFKFINFNVSNINVVQQSITIYFDYINNIQILSFINNNLNIIQDLYNLPNKFKSTNYIYNEYNLIQNFNSKHLKLFNTCFDNIIDTHLHRQINFDNNHVSKYIHSLNDINNKFQIMLKFKNNYKYDINNPSKIKIINIIIKIIQCDNINVINYVLHKYHNIISIIINNTSNFLILYENIKNITFNNDNELTIFIKNINRIIDSKFINSLEKDELIKTIIYIINNHNNKNLIIKKLIMSQNNFIINYKENLNTEEFIEFINTINNIIDMNINKFINNTINNNVLNFIKNIIYTKNILFTNNETIQLINKKINCLIKSNEFYNHVPQYEKRHILISSFNSWNTNSYTDLNEYNYDFMFLNYLKNNSETFETININKKLYYCLENGKIKIQINNLILTLLPIQLLILEQIQNNIHYDDIIDYSFDKQKLINIFIINHIIDCNNNILSIKEHQYETELNIIKDYHNKTKIINIKHETAHDKIDIIKCIINHILKYSNKNYDELFNDTVNISNGLIFDNELFNKALDELINKDYINIDNDIYQKIVY